MRMLRYSPLLLVITITAFIWVDGGLARASSGEQINLDATLPAAMEACEPSWGVVPSPNGSGDDNELGAISVISANDMWAVGNTGTGLTSLNTLTEHWNGSSWTVVPSPNGTFGVNFLADVDGVASNDVWAVGSSWNGSTSNNQSRTLILHWNGTNWSKVPSPNTTSPENRLLGVVAIAANNVWAVGSSYDYTFYKTLIMHWNGVAWSIVPSPNPRDFNILYAIDAASANDVWAVGSQQDTLEQTLVVHWNGLNWSVVPSPQVGPYGNNMIGVDVVSANDIWAVGFHLTVFGFTQPYQTSTFHYNGSGWSIVPSPNVNQLNNYLFDVAGLSPTDAWAVGLYDTGTALNTMIQHWNGSSWAITPSPSPSTYSNELVGIDAVSATDVWAVGRAATTDFFGVSTLVERFTGACGGALEMHVSDIQPSYQLVRDSYRVKAAITILDAGGAAVSGATVTIKTTLPNGQQITRSRLTNNSGIATHTVSSKLVGTYTFEVTNVVKSGWTYDAAANVETSDAITIQ